jgi:4-hydroxy-3-polyprenylbenzoate decarboxylase
MLRLARAGAHILPASPGFYHRPQSIEELVDHLVFRLLDQFGVPHSQRTRWQGDPALTNASPAAAADGD